MEAARVGLGITIVGATACALASSAWGCGLDIVGARTAADGGAPPGPLPADASAPRDGDAPTGDAEAPCRTTVCGGACVDTSRDPLHCGACSSPCAGGEVCANGGCRTGCPEKEVPCDGTCCAGVCAANACKSPELWLRADEGVTTNGSFVWADQSGKGRDVSQTTATMFPTVIANQLAGRQVLWFTGAQRLHGPDVTGFQLGQGDLAWFHVSRSLGNNDERNQVFGTIQNMPPHRGMTAGFGPGDRPYGLLRQSNGQEIFLRADTGSYADWVIMDLRRTNGTAELRRNGVVVATGESKQDVSGGAITIGSERLDGTEYLVGDIAEILIFAGPFSDAERASVAQYLSGRHQIPLL